MSVGTQQDIAALIIEWVKVNKRSSNMPESAINENTDLMSTGLVDSFGFIDLILFIEEEYGVKINLVDVDPSEFTVVKGLCNITLASSDPVYPRSLAIMDNDRQ